ncbi:MAG: CPBP family intramembrane metalloprotease [Oscillospiraceae bacterium]|nr:CPBP family intramembrane metalloprotease [Oscillospiraceae bacterium]
MDRKQLRKALGVAGWTALIYNLIMMVCVVVTMIAEMIIGMMAALNADGFDYGSIMGAAMAAASSAWGYFVSAAVGIIILLAWKKPRYWNEEIWKKGKPMKAGAFWGILAVFLSAQFLYQLYTISLEVTLNGMGLTMMEGLEAMSAGSDSFSMFLYMGLLAPVTEELLFRGLIQRTLMPYGKKIAILGSAFLFGMMHGNILQTPFAFLVGLVLGYVASEYSIAWAMVLHMINNLVLGDMLTRLTSGMGETGAALVIWGILIISVIGAIVTLIRKRREIRAWSHGNAMGPTYVRCFFSSAGVITFTVVMVISTIATCFALITPL